MYHDENKSLVMNLNSYTCKIINKLKTSCFYALVLLKHSVIIITN